MKKIRAIVSGTVQGVGFRISTLQQARQIGVNGYVRNLSNGDVEIVICGEADKVDRLLKWAEFGPPSALVRSLNIEEIDENGAEFDHFAIIR